MVVVWLWWGDLQNDVMMNRPHAKPCNDNDACTGCCLACERANLPPPDAWDDCDMCVYNEP